jgi:flagellar hook-basal body complex protein FliE
MADPLGLIGGAGGLNPARPAQGQRPSAAGDEAQGPSFKDVLLENLRQVDRMQKDADRAIVDLQTGARADVEGVILATQKADMAFRMLQSVRNRMMEAYDEIKQIRV